MAIKSAVPSVNRPAAAIVVTSEPQFLQSSRGQTLRQPTGLGVTLITVALLNSWPFSK